MCETILRILDKLDWNTFIGIFIGVYITYFFTLRKEKKDLEQTRKDFKKILCSQFRELRLRLANLCYHEMVEAGLATQEGLIRICRNLTDIENNEDVDRWRELAQMEDEKLAEVGQIKNEKGQPRAITGFRVPALEEAIASVHLLEANHQESLFSLMTKIDSLNEHIEQYRFFFNMLLGGGEVTQSPPETYAGRVEGILLKDRLEQRWGRFRLEYAKSIAQLSLNILDNMAELLKELSE